MGNMCNFSMKLKGTAENIETFHDWMTQNGATWMGHGAESEYDTEQLREVMINAGDNIFTIIIGGSVNNSVLDALVSDAIEMRTTPNRWSWKGMDYESMTFVTLFEACEQLHLDMEVFSEEPSCCFAEHILFKDGEVMTKETVPFTEFWDEEKEDFIRSGGYEVKFEI